MSWLGTHPIATKAQARAVLTPGACKRTVYLARCLPLLSGARTNHKPQTCFSCGVTLTPADVVAALEHQATKES